MKRALAAATAGLLSVAFVVAGGTAALAGPLPTDVTITFDTGVPVSGESVHADRVIAGTASALEGIVRVDLYVVRHRAAGTPVQGTPTATKTQQLPLSSYHFAFGWDVSSTPQGLVDVVVVARTATRNAASEIDGIQVGPRALPAPAAARKTTTAPVRSAAAAHVAAVGRVAAPKAAVAPPTRVPADAISQGQAQAFFRSYGQLAYPRRAPALAPAVAPRAVLVAPLRPSRAGWASVAAGLLLVVVAAHAYRAARTGG